MWPHHLHILLLTYLVTVTLVLAYQLPESVLNHTISFPDTSSYYSNTPASFYDARDNCNYITGQTSFLNHLAVITSDEELERLQTVFKGMYYT